MREFNITGVCVPKKHYMVSTENKLEKIKELIDKEKYFTINRARQFGKTTTLTMLEYKLHDAYIVASISFEGVGEALFQSEEKFCTVFKSMLGRAFIFSSLDKEELEKWNKIKIYQLYELSELITSFCEGKKIVLLIDEVDKASDNKIFLHFLGMLRDKYLKRERQRDYTFHSVVLAGVHDIKNIKQKLVREGKYTQSKDEGKAMLDNNLYNIVSETPTAVDISETKSTTNYQAVPSHNSPWNIAAKFDVDLSFHVLEIATMLTEYEADYKTGMDIALLSQEIYNYTCGYPFLVSDICKTVDEVLGKDWSIFGVQNAVKIILDEKNTLFDDISKNLENYPELYRFIYDIMIVGESKSFQITNPIIDLGVTFGIFVNANGRVAISNKIFETLIYNYFISKDESSRRKRISGVMKYDVVKDGHFNMVFCLDKFAAHYKEMFDDRNEQDISFLERHGRMVFLSYLKPLINGVGFYHIESQFTDLRRMDLVVDYGRDQFIIELKIWYGDASHKNAYDQLLGYMESKNATTGYLLTFDFRKAENRRPKAEWVVMNGKRIYDLIL